MFTALLYNVATPWKVPLKNLFPGSPCSRTRPMLEASENSRVPSFQELLSAPHAQFRAWCNGPLAYECGDLLSAASILRLTEVHSVLETAYREAAGSMSADTVEHIKRILPHLEPT